MGRRLNLNRFLISGNSSIAEKQGTAIGIHIHPQVHAYLYQLKA